VGLGDASAGLRRGRRSHIPGPCQSANAAGAAVAPGASELSPPHPGPCNLVSAAMLQDHSTSCLNRFTLQSSGRGVVVRGARWKGP